MVCAQVGTTLTLSLQGKTVCSSACILGRGIRWLAPTASSVKPDSKLVACMVQSELTGTLFTGLELFGS